MLYISASFLPKLLDYGLSISSPSIEMFTFFSVLTGLGGQDLKCKNIFAFSTCFVCFFGNSFFFKNQALLFANVRNSLPDFSGPKNSTSEFYIF